MTEGDEIGHTEKVWVLRAALDRDARMRNSASARPPGVDPTASAAFFTGRP